MRELSCRHISFSRPGPGGKERCVIDDISTAFCAGQVHLIGGDTGAGKSTLVHLLAGLIRPGKGEIAADGEAVSRWVSAHKDLWRRRVGIIFQHARLLPGLSAVENVMAPLIPRAMKISDIRLSARAALESIGAGHLAGKGVHELSGGERQKVAIARALCPQPELILADEPTAHQDDAATACILERLRAHADAGRIVVVTAHDHRVMRSRFADRRFKLIQGKLGGELSPFGGDGADGANGAN